MTLMGVATLKPVGVTVLDVRVELTGTLRCGANEKGSGDVLAAMASAKGCETAWLAASVAVTVKLKLPLAVGVPESVPVAALRLSPAGRVPAETECAYGGVPPDTTIVCEYTDPMLPSGSVVVTICKGPAVVETNSAEIPPITSRVLTEVPGVLADVWRRQTLCPGNKLPASAV